MSDEPLDRNAPIAKKAIYEHAPKVRAMFDEALGTEISQACDAHDAAMRIFWQVDSTLPTLPESEKFQVGHALGASHKALNDILGSLDDLRSGRLDHAQALMRLVEEGFATAVLIAHDSEICQAYASGRYSVNDSVQKLRIRCEELGIPAEMAKKFEDAYKVRHKSAHPTFPSIGLSFDFERKQLSIGGNFIEVNIPLYRAHLNNLVANAKNIRGFLQARLLRPATSEGAT